MNNNPLSLIFSAIFYVVVIVITFFSMFSVFILIKYGQHRILSLSVSILYTLFYLLLLIQAYSLLQKL